MMARRLTGPAAVSAVYLSVIHPVPSGALIAHFWRGETDVQTVL